MLKLPRRLRLRTIGDDILKKPTLPIESVDDEIRSLAQMMIDALDTYRGVGLAANQVGFSLRMFAIGAPDPTEDELAESPLSPGEKLLLPLMPMVLINPEIVVFHTECADYEEGCLSIPKVYGMVNRPTRITLKAQLLNGETFIAETGGFSARIIQHEIDHLNGLVYPDRMTEAARTRIQSKLENLIAGNQVKFLKKLIKKKN